LSPKGEGRAEGEPRVAHPTVQTDRLDFPRRFIKVILRSNASLAFGQVRWKTIRRPLMKSERTYSIRVVVLAVISLVVAGGFLLAQTSADKEASGDLRAGRSFILTRVYSETEDARMLALFDGLRVADVSDGMDAVGLQNIGLMDADIRALWKDTEHFSHRFVGIAVTARYVPTQLPPAGRMKTDDYDKWVGHWYRNRSSEPFVPLLRKGT